MVELALYVILLTLLSGLASFFGALLAAHPGILKKWLKNETRHAIIAFGGGALLAAVALVLLPEGMALLPPSFGLIAFTLGGAAFMYLDRYLKEKGSSVSQLIAMMLDFIPEAIVLGALIADNFREAVFMAIIIAAQNMPEGFNAFREMLSSSHNPTKKHLLTVIALCGVTGILWGLLGFLMFDANSAALGSIMVFCAGGIFYLVFRDIAPQAALKKHWYPSFGAVLGFVFCLGAQQLL